MKFDKETLIKHRFWVLLVVFVPLWLIAVLLILGDVGGKKKKKDDFDKAMTAVKIKEPKNQSFLDPLKLQEETFRKQKDKVWKVAWVDQDGLMTWADDPKAPLGRKLKNAYFGDDIPEYNERIYYARNLYPTQFDEFNDLITPAEYKDSVEKVITRITSWTAPRSEELWLAQEDYWVQRELVRAVRDAMDSVAKFKIPEDAKKQPPAVPAGALARYRLSNPNWELDLIIEQRGKNKVISEKSKIKNVNVNQRLEKLDGVFFQLTQKGDGGAELDRIPWRIEGEPLAWGAETEVRKSVIIDTFDPKKPPEVEQLFTWYTSPIKRLDRVEVGNKLAVAHRTANRPLMPKQIGKPEEENPEANPMGGGGGPPGGGGGPPGAGGPMGLGGPMGGGPPPGLGGGGNEGGGGAASATKTRNGLERNRYIDLSDQVRRIPVAVVMVVDQAFIPDVLTALANSRLRMWTTQVQWQHVHGIKPQNQSSAFVAGGNRGPGGPREGGGPMGNDEGPAVGPNGGGSKGGPPRPPGGSGKPPGLGGPMGGGPMGGGPEGGFGSSSGSPPDEDDPNLVELVVYNIASLYERFPPRSALPAETPGGGPPMPMPMGGGAPAPKP